MTFYWWNDAVAFAHQLAVGTAIRHKVHRTASGWTVDLADDAVAVEACS